MNLRAVDYKTQINRRRFDKHKECNESYNRANRFTRPSNYELWNDPVNNPHNLIFRHKVTAKKIS